MSIGLRVQRIAICMVYLSVLVTLLITSHMRSGIWWMQTENRPIKRTKTAHYKHNDSSYVINQRYEHNGFPSERKQFEFYINDKNACKQKESNSIKLLIVVYVAVNQKKERNFIRHGWGKVARENSNCHLIFLLGKPADGNTANLVAESRIHKDIVAADYTDTYRNLTLKSFAMFQWVTQYCDHAQYVLKIDSDVKINITELLHVIRTRNIPDEFNCGRDIKISKVNRNKNIKCFVSRSEYPNDNYPHHCWGPAFIMSRRLIRKLSTVPIPFTSPFPVDDVYVTGILREDMNEAISTRLFRFRHDKLSDRLD